MDGGKPCEIAGESSGEKERYGSDDRLDGRETVGNSSVGKERDGSYEKVDGQSVGNSMGRGLRWGRSEMEATRGWTGRRTPWEI